MANEVLAPEFELIAACCHWPMTDTALANIQSKMGDLDWPKFMRLANRHRVGGLVHHAFVRGEVTCPSAVAAGLAVAARNIAGQSLLLAAETLRLQDILEKAGVSVVILKGAPLAQLAYGTLALKHSNDIDIVVRPEQAFTALECLEADGYVLSQPARELNSAQRRAVIAFGRDLELVHARSKVRVDLHWQLAYNRALLEGFDPFVTNQFVSVPGCGLFRTLATGDLFAYLCVHGADHAWFRLKWLADLNAFAGAEKLEALVHHARQRGAGICAAQAVRLLERLLQKAPPESLADDIGSARVRRLTAASIRAVALPESAAELAAGTWTSISIRLQLGEFQV